MKQWWKQLHVTTELELISWKQNKNKIKTCCKTTVQLTETKHNLSEIIKKYFKNKNRKGISRNPKRGETEIVSQETMS